MTEAPHPEGGAISVTPSAAQDDGDGRPDLLATLAVTICPNPVFVIGSPRSGTSIVPWSLAHHPDFWTSRETYFISMLFGGDRPVGNADEIYEAMRENQTTFLSHHDVSKREFLSSLGLGINALISRRSEGRRWVDQTPGYTGMAYVLAEMFPGAHFLHILRDGRSVVNSMLHFGDLLDRQQEGVAPPEWAGDFDESLRTWTTYVESALEFCAVYPDRALTVRNEDLLEHPEGEFERIFTFLGASYHQDPANFFRTSRINSSFGPLVWGSPAEQHVGSRGERIRVGNAADAWHEWNDEQRSSFIDDAGELMRRLGYFTEPAG